VTSPGQPQRPDTYEPFFGFNEPPFSLVPDPRFLFASASHSAALAQVAYALERREPLMVISGEIGTGKTLLCRTVLQRLPFKTFLSVIDDPLLESDELIKELLKDFGVIAKDPTRFGGATRHELVQTLHAFLNSLAPIQAHAVVMIDEAQHLRPDVLEQIRLLSNIDDARGTILQIILVGQADLLSLLERPDLRQLHQRVSRRFSLEPLNAEEVQKYIQHRLTLARHEPASPATPSGPEFTADAIGSVATISNGVPRVINLLCDRALELAFATRRRSIDGGTIRAAALALGIEGQTPVSPGVAGQDRVTHTSIWQAVEVQADVTSSPETVADIVSRAEAAATPAAEFGVLAPQSESPRVKRYLTLAALFALLVVAALFGWQRLRTPIVVEAPASTPVPARRPAAVQPARGPASTEVPPSKESATSAAAPPQPDNAAPAPAAPATTTFDIVVASFRTEARATSVAEQVTALGVPVRRRESDGWQQVVAGPFASRSAAEEAQQRIHGAGLTGTQIAAVVK
jgi:type II secretory pathway predicted ATPase ExeA/cell division septation protein DedD